MFSTILPEVISKYVFPFLLVNDLLRLRRVCKISKDLADDYLRVYGTSERIIRLNQDYCLDDLTTFLALPFPVPVTRFDLVNEDNSAWDSEHMQLFLRLYGDKITHLEIYRLVIPIKSPSTVQFFEGLPNLEELSIEELKEDTEFTSPHLNIPSTFKRLKHLHVGEYVCCRPQLMLAFLEECSTNLERVSFPRSSSRFRAPEDMFEWVRRIISTRHRENPDTPNLKYLDLERFRGHDAQPYLRSFYELVTTCSAHNVKLQHVDAKWIEAMMQLDTPDRGLHGEKISRCVVSIWNLTTSMFRLELPLLEKINIRYTSWCSMPEGDFEAQPWSNLKELKLWVDSEYFEREIHGGGERVSVSRLFEFLSSSSCPSLKKLYFRNWPGSNRDVVQLWGNLPLLEDVAFHYCINLGDAAFLGDDVTTPPIFKATRLKSISFEYFYMPGITDALFTSALRHMPLKNLYLESWGQVSSITLAGLESLLDSEFAKTIEKFPLKGKVKLEGVSEDQLAELEGRFRSSQM